MLFSEYDSQGRLVDTDKWDNHNTIARGWAGSGECHYQPVTFRKIYGAKSVIGPSPLPTSSSRIEQEQPAPQPPPETASVAAEQEGSTVQDEGYADL